MLFRSVASGRQQIADGAAARVGGVGAGVADGENETADRGRRVGFVLLDGVHVAIMAYPDGSPGRP